MSKTLTPRRKAQDIAGWVQSACFEMGGEMGADDLFNDSDFLEDTLGDKLHDYAKGQQERLDIMMELNKCMSHAAATTAIASLLAKEITNG